MARHDGRLVPIVLVALGLLVTPVACICPGAGATAVHRGQSGPPEPCHGRTAPDAPRDADRHHPACADCHGSIAAPGASGGVVERGASSPVLPAMEPASRAASGTAAVAPTARAGAPPGGRLLHRTRVLQL